MFEMNNQKDSQINEKNEGYAVAGGLVASETSHSRSVERREEEPNSDRYLSVRSKQLRNAVTLVREQFVECLHCVDYNRYSEYLLDQPEETKSDSN